jgi:nucleoside-diphosphate-sugar epimerase
MRALVTGSSGFIGSHTLARLLELGFDVDGIDIREGKDVRKFFAKDKVRYDLVVHCAAVVGGRALIEESALGHSFNLDIDAGLFRWASLTRPHWTVYFSSVAAYPAELQTFERGRRLHEADMHWDRIRPPDELYGWAKLTGEYLAARARKAGLGITVVRPFGVYGPGQDERTPFAGFMRQAKAHVDPVKVWGLGNQVRDFIHVEDVVEAVVVLARERYNGDVNLCSGRAVRLVEAARMFADAAGYSPDVVGDPAMAAGLEYRLGSPLRLNEHYVPQVTLEQGIKDMMSRP